MLYPSLYLTTLQQRILDGAAQLKHNAPDWIKPH